MNNALGLGAKGYHARNQDATIWIGNLEEQVTEDILFELMVQFGPVGEFEFPSGDNVLR